MSRGHRAGGLCRRPGRASAPGWEPPERLLAVEEFIAGRSAPGLYRVARPLMVAGPGSFVDSAITWAGGRTSRMPPRAIRALAAR